MIIVKFRFICKPFFYLFHAQGLVAGIVVISILLIATLVLAVITFTRTNHKEAPFVDVHGHDDDIGIEMNKA